MPDDPHRFIPKPSIGTRYYHYRRSRDTYRGFNLTDQESKARTAFDTGKPVLSGFVMKVDWATGDRKWIFSARTTEKERRNAVIEAMNHPNEVYNGVNPSDHPTHIHRQIFGTHPQPEIDRRSARYTPPR